MEVGVSETHSTSYLCELEVRDCTKGSDRAQAGPTRDSWALGRRHL